MRAFLFALLATVGLVAGDFTYGGFVGIKAPQKELKDLTNSSPGTAVGGLVSYEFKPGQAVRVIGGYDFYPQYVSNRAYYVNVAKTGSWVLGLDYQYTVLPKLYVYVGGGVKHWNYDLKQTYTRDLSWKGTTHSTYTANKVYANVGTGYTFAKNFAVEASYTFGKIAETMTAQSLDAKFIVKY